MGSSNLGFNSESNDASKKPAVGASTDKTTSSKLLEASQTRAPEQGGGGSSSVAKFALPADIFRAEKPVIPKAETVTVGSQPIPRATVTSDLASGNQVQASAATIDSRYFNPAQTDTYSNSDALTGSAGSGRTDGARPGDLVRSSGKHEVVAAPASVTLAPAQIDTPPSKTERITRTDSSIPTVPATRPDNQSATPPSPRTDSVPASSIMPKPDVSSGAPIVARNDSTNNVPSVFSNRSFVDLVGPASGGTRGDTTGGEVSAPSHPARGDTPSVVPNSSVRNDVPGVVPNSSARNDAPAVVPNSSTRNDAPAVVPNSSARNDAPAVVPNSSARNDAPAVVPNSSARNDASAVVPNSSARNDAPVVAPNSSSRTDVIPGVMPPNSAARDAVIPVGREVVSSAPPSTWRTSDSTPSASSALSPRPETTPAVRPDVARDATREVQTNTSDRASVISQIMQSPDSITVNRATPWGAAQARLNDAGVPASATNVSDRPPASQTVSPGDRPTAAIPSDKNASVVPGSASTDRSGQPPADRSSVSDRAPTSPIADASNKAGQQIGIDPRPNDLPKTQSTDQQTRPGDQGRPGDIVKVAGDVLKPGDQTRPADPPKPGDQARLSDPPKPGDQARLSDPTKPGDQARLSDPTKPGDQPRPGDPTKPGDQRFSDSAKPADANRTADNTKSSQDLNTRPSESARTLDSVRAASDTKPGDQFRPDGARSIDGTKTSDPRSIDAPKSDARISEPAGSRPDVRGNDPGNKFDSPTSPNRVEARSNDAAANKFEANRSADLAAGRLNEQNQRGGAEIRPADLRLNERPQDNANPNVNVSENVRGQFAHRWHELRDARNAEAHRISDIAAAQRQSETNIPVRNWDAANAKAQDAALNNSANRQEQNTRHEGAVRPQELVRNPNESAPKVEMKNESSIRTSDARTEGRVIEPANRAEPMANRGELTAHRTNENAATRAESQANRAAEQMQSKPESNSHRPVDQRADMPNHRGADNIKQPDAPKPDPSSSNVPIHKPNENRTDAANLRGSEHNSDSRRVEPHKPSDTSAGAIKLQGNDSAQISDRINQFTDASKSQQPFAPNLVATQKEADAVRQILNELKQNQNLSSSEVLELPSFKDAIRLLDSIRHKDSDSEGDRKQNFPTQLVEAMRLSEFLKVLERASEQEQRKIHKQQWAERSVAQQHRVRYLVKNGDTLESIAEEVLGDKRFVPLLVTINRAEIIFTAISGTTEAVVYEGQYLWIPTPNEVAIHQKHYFAPNAAAVRGEPISPAAETPIRVDELEAPTTVREFAPATPKTFIAPPIVKPEGPASSPMALVLYRLRFAGNRDSVNLDEVKQQESAPSLAAAPYRRQHKVRLGETLQSIAIHDPGINDVNMWVLICKLNGLDTAVDVVGRPRAQLNKGDLVWLPTADEIEEFKVISRLVQIAQLAGQNIDADLNKRFAPVEKPAPEGEESAPKSICRIDRKMVIEKIADHCRMIMTDNPDKSYGIKLQRETIDGKWITVASYECKEGKTHRNTYKIDGSKNCLEVGLPAAVSREMATEDFQRNWRFYYNRYTSLKSDTLELNFSEQHRATQS